jgi:hypothetical protein
VGLVKDYNNQPHWEKDYPDERGQQGGLARPNLELFFVEVQKEKQSKITYSFAASASAERVRGGDGGSGAEQ